MHKGISDKEFKKFQALIFEWAGITMSDAKKVLVEGRLSKRLRHHNVDSFEEYYQIVISEQYPDEAQKLIDLLTTNETYFFREEKHFDYLQNTILPDHKGQSIRIWSAACSRGAEPYSLGMILSDTIGKQNWEIFATDISSKVLDIASEGIYPMEAAEKIPRRYLQEYCLEGVRSQQGYFTLDDSIKRNIKFQQINLNGKWDYIGQFDVVFLRNVMIYFNQQTKLELIRRISATIKSGGYLIIGHSETLNGIQGDLKIVSPSIYQKP